MAHFKESLKKDLDDAVAPYRMSSSAQKKKLVLWCIRQTLSVLIYAVLWDYAWVRWTLLATIPLAAFSLVYTLTFNYWIERRIQRAKSRIDKA